MYIQCETCKDKLPKSKASYINGKYECFLCGLEKIEYNIDNLKILCSYIIMPTTKEKRKENYRLNKIEKNNKLIQSTIDVVASIKGDIPICDVNPRVSYNKLKSLLYDWIIIKLSNN